MATYIMDGGCFVFTPIEELETDLAEATIKREYTAQVHTRDLRIVLAQYQDALDYIRLCASNDAYANELLKRMEGRNA